MLPDLPPRLRIILEIINFHLGEKVEYKVVSFGLLKLITESEARASSLVAKATKLPCAGKSKTTLTSS